MRRLALAAALTVVATAAPVHAQETVSFTFGWKPGMVADVSTTSRMESNMMGSMTMMEEARQRMRVLEHPRGLVILTDSMQVAEGGMADVMAAAGDMSELGGGVVSTTVVSPEGRFVEVAELDSISAALRASFEAMPGMEAMEEMRAAMPGMVEMMENLFSPEHLRTTAEEGWQQLVGQWAGRTVALGDTVRTESTMPMNMGQEVTSRASTWVSGRVPCSTDAEERRCVEIRVMQEPDADAMAEMVRAQVESMLGSGVPPEMMAEFEGLDMDMGMETVVVTDPATLLPQKISFNMRTDMSMPGLGQRMSQSQITEVAFRWR